MLGLYVDLGGRENGERSKAGRLCPDWDSSWSRDGIGVESFDDSASAQAADSLYGAREAIDHDSAIGAESAYG